MEAKIEFEKEIDKADDETLERILLKMEKLKYKMNKRFEKPNIEDLTKKKLSQPHSRNLKKFGEPRIIDELNILRKVNEQCKKFDKEVQEEVNIELFKKQQLIVNERSDDEQKSVHELIMKLEDLKQEVDRDLIQKNYDLKTPNILEKHFQREITHKFGGTQNYLKNKTDSNVKDQLIEPQTISKSMPNSLSELTTNNTKTSDQVSMKKSNLQTRNALSKAANVSLVSLCYKDDNHTKSMKVLPNLTSHILTGIDIEPKMSINHLVNVVNESTQRDLNEKLQMIENNDAKDSNESEEGEYSSSENCSSIESKREVSHDGNLNVDSVNLNNKDENKFLDKENTNLHSVIEEELNSTTSDKENSNSNNYSDSFEDDLNTFYSQGSVTDRLSTIIEDSAEANINFSSSNSSKSYSRIENANTKCHLPSVNNKTNQSTQTKLEFVFNELEAVLNKSTKNQEIQVDVYADFSHLKSHATRNQETQSEQELTNTTNCNVPNSLKAIEKKNQATQMENRKEDEAHTIKSSLPLVIDEGPLILSSHSPAPPIAPTSCGLLKPEINHCMDLSIEESISENGTKSPLLNTKTSDFSSTSTSLSVSLSSSRVIPLISSEDTSLGDQSDMMSEGQVLLDDCNTNIITHIQLQNTHISDGEISINAFDHSSMEQSLNSEGEIFQA